MNFIYIVSILLVVRIENLCYRWMLRPLLLLNCFFLVLTIFDLNRYVTHDLFISCFWLFRYFSSFCLLLLSSSLLLIDLLRFVFCSFFFFFTSVDHSNFKRVQTLCPHYNVFHFNRIVCIFLPYNLYAHHFRISVFQSIHEEKKNQTTISN